MSEHDEIGSKLLKFVKYLRSNNVYDSMWNDVNLFILSNDPDRGCVARYETRSGSLILSKYVD